MQPGLEREVPREERAGNTEFATMRMESLKLFIRFALLPATVVRALKVAAVVTPILTVLNHSHEIAAGDYTMRFFWQTVLTFCVPYLVSTYSSAMTELATFRNAQIRGGGGT